MSHLHCLQATAVACPWAISHLPTAALQVLQSFPQGLPVGNCHFSFPRPCAATCSTCRQGQVLQMQVQRRPSCQAACSPVCLCFPTQFCQFTACRTCMAR